MPFDCTKGAESGIFGPVSQINHTSLVAVVTSTGRPNSVRNRFVNEVFVAVLFLCCRFAFLNFLWVYSLFP